jgi:hypothetical protein
LSRILDELRDEVELEGYEPGTPEFERIFLARRVKKCQEFQLVEHCTQCKAFDYCELAKQHMKNLKYGGR